jgi:ubiquinone/menaquinone biosynthesis C-methylase UbiE
MTTTPATATAATTHAGTSPHTPGSRDPYARITELDEATVASLAERFEIRAADPRQRQLWNDALSRAPSPAGPRVLEVGCGTGIITALIADLPGATEVVGVDPATGFVDRARRRAPSLRFQVADGRALPFGDASFDGVVLATTLCHIPEPGRALAEARRVLRPGGYLLVYDGDYATTTVALAQHDPLQTCAAAAVAAIVHDPWLVRRLPAMLTAAGLVPGQLRSHGYLDVETPHYLPSFVDLGADTLATRGTITPSTAAALKDEARHRAEAGSFFGHIAYASILANRPETP